MTADSISTRCCIVGGTLAGVIAHVGEVIGLIVDSRRSPGVRARTRAVYRRFERRERAGLKVDELVAPTDVLGLGCLGDRKIPEETMGRFTARRIFLQLWRILAVRLRDP
jgi:hypothetical protein